MKKKFSIASAILALGLMACSDNSSSTSPSEDNSPQQTTPTEKKDALSCDIQTNFGGIPNEECSEAGTTDADKFKSDCEFNRGTIGTGCPTGYTLKCPAASGKTYYFYDQDAKVFGCELMVSE